MALDAGSAGWVAWHAIGMVKAAKQALDKRIRETMLDILCIRSLSDAEQAPCCKRFFA